MGDQGHIGQKVLGEQLLALVDVGLGVAAPVGRQANQPPVDLCEAHQLQGFGDGQQLIDFEVGQLGQAAQLGLAFVGRGGHRLDQAGQGVGGDVGQGHADAHAREIAVADRLGRAAHGHAGVDVVHKGAERWIQSLARLRHVDLDLGDHPTRIGREHQDSVAHQDRFFDVVGHDQDRADRHPSFAPEIQKVGAQGLCCQDVEG